MELSERYFHWICHIAMNGEAGNYQKLLHYLYNKNYRYTHPRDANRESDGIDLRYRFGYLNGIALPEITCELDDKPCSVLEMMVALAIRCEENILLDFEIGDRTYEWFQDMLKSLGVDQNDDEFNYSYVDSTIEHFLDRDYAPDGCGSLFHLRHPPDDMRRAEIWYQAMWWIDEIT
jgi:hypothetical protein